MPALTWTAEDEAVLRDAAQRGLSTSAIARKLGGGFSRSAVTGKAHRLNLRVGTVSRRENFPCDAPPAVIRTCQWPEGNPGEAGFRFCDATPVEPGKPYCAAHCRRAYRPPAAEPEA